ncbi:MAG: hypothetical protein ABI867_41930 [Kofleriaceae bacterium]
MIKLLVGILKGAVIGGALGYGAYALGDVPVLSNPWILYGLIGAIVGLFVGKPVWALIKDKNATNVIAILKAAFGFGIGCGLYAIIAKAWNPTLEIAAIENVFAWPPTLGGAIGAVYGGFVELDDAIGDDKSGDKKPAAKNKKQLPPADEA